jgi:hypothetical protein
LKNPPRPPGGTIGNLSPKGDQPSPEFNTDQGCSVIQPSATESCTFDATMNGAVTGYGANPGDWTVRITHASQPLVIKGFGGAQVYDCGTIKPGDHVVVTGKQGSSVGAGNPFATCF